jgi:hypothetical protein
MKQTYLDSVMSVRVWGWLLASCIAVAVLSVIMMFNAYAMLNDYKSTRQQDITQYRSELVRAINSQEDSLRQRIDNSNTQIKQYVDVQIPLIVRNSLAPASPQTFHIDNSNKTDTRANSSR